jgi:hypothetical protein
MNRTTKIVLLGLAIYGGWASSLGRLNVPENVILALSAIMFLSGLIAGIISRSSSKLTSDSIIVGAISMVLYGVIGLVSLFFEDASNSRLTDNLYWVVIAFGAGPLIIFGVSCALRPMGDVGGDVE